MVEKIGSKAEKNDAIEIEQKKVEKEEKKIGKSINEYLKERGIEAPPVSLHIFFSGHYYVNDLDGIDASLDQADVVIPEISGWDKRHLDIFRMVSMGQISAEKAIGRMPGFRHDKYFEKLFEKLYDSKKAVVFADVHKDSATREAADEVAQQYAQFFYKDMFNQEQSFDQAMDRTKFVLKRYDQVIIKERENYILHEFGPRVEQAILENPDLLKKDEIKTLLLFGYGHNEFYHNIKDQVPKTSRQFLQMPMVFGYEDELMKRQRLGMSIDEGLCARALLEKIIWATKFQEIVAQSKNTADLTKSLRKIAEKFSLEEIKEVFSHIREKEFVEYFDFLLTSKGVYLPVQAK